jgi:RimJ/RimL family protein N-acetyltransferase
MDEPGKAAVGYWLAPEARGRGVATGAVQLLVRWAFDVELELVRMELLTLVGNEASGRVALRAGFTREGVLRRYLPFRGDLVDAVMFARLRDDPGG